MTIDLYNALIKIDKVSDSEARQVADKATSKEELAKLELAERRDSSFIASY